MKRTWTKHEDGFYSVVWALIVVACMASGWGLFDAIHLMQHHP